LAELFRQPASFTLKVQLAVAGGIKVALDPGANLAAQCRLFLVERMLHNLSVKPLTRELLLIVQHFAVDETEPAEEMLHFILTVADQGEDGLDAVVLSRFGEVPDEFLSDSLAAIRWINADYFDPRYGPR
jgi:hypothetical protein